MVLTHRLVEVFRALMASGNVTRAAELLHTSQPTVSRELARLEQVLGLQLFERVKGRLRPTVRALALQQEVEQSYVGLDRIAATAASLRDFASGRLQVVCQPALAHALLPDAVRRFAALQPEASVIITPMESPMLEAALSEQRFDLGLTEQVRAPVATTLQALLSTQEVCVLPNGHRLCGKAQLALADFEDEVFISLAPTDPYRQQIDALFERAGVRRRLQFESPSAVSVCALVGQGLGVAIVNPLTALALAGTGLVVRPWAGRIAFEVALVLPAWRSEHPLRAQLVTSLVQAADAMALRLSKVQT
jgi:DNA-binding transcriptional LysR family regulator